MNRPDRATRTRVAHAVLIVAGLLIALYPLTFGARTTLTCRGVDMAPQTVCMKADGSAGQTYEQRLATRQAARPVIGVVGLLVAGFGTTLLVADLRRRPGGQPDATPRSAVEDAG